MTEPHWLVLSFILSLQHQLLDSFGGISGVRDEGFLESALVRPQHLWAYEQPSIYLLAATYAHGLMKNHPFLDGNTRIGFMAAYVFLGRQDVWLVATEEEAVLYTVGLASGQICEGEYAEWLERNCTFDLSQA